MKKTQNTLKSYTVKNSRFLYPPYYVGDRLIAKNFSNRISPCFIYYYNSLLSDSIHEHIDKTVIALDGRGKFYYTSNAIWPGLEVDISFCDFTLKDIFPLKKLLKSKDVMDK